MQFVDETLKIACEVAHGELGGQVKIDDAQGCWKLLSDNMNVMAFNLTNQVREIVEVVRGVAGGNLSETINVQAQGEILESQNIINTMVAQLKTFAFEVTSSRETGVEGRLGGQAVVVGAEGIWKELTDNVNAMATNELTQYQREMLSTVHDLANSLLTITDGILDISKIEANRMTIEQVEFTLRGTVFDALKSLAVKSIEKPLELIYRVDASFPDCLIGDFFRLRQVILNLVGNAFKFTSEGHVMLSLRKATKSLEQQIKLSIKDDDTSSDFVTGTDDSTMVKPADLPNDDTLVLEFCVSDTGIGIKKDKLDLIFENFTQTDGSTTRKFGCTGLGLSMSKRLIHLMSGEIWVNSAYGQESRFFFTIAVKPVKGGFTRKSSTLLTFNLHQILFISIQHNQEEMNKIEHDLSASPTVVTNVEDAQFQDPCKNDVIIIDSMEMGSRLRQLQEIKYIPFVLLHPQIPNLNMRSCLDLGIQSYGNTPCSQMDLAGYLKPALE